MTDPVVSTEDTVNANINTGKVEVQIREIVVENPADLLPMQVVGDQDSVKKLIEISFLIFVGNRFKNIILRS